MRFFFVLDAVERPFIARSWAARTIGADGRDFGVEGLYATDAFEARLFLHNGDGGWDRSQGNLREDIGRGALTGGVDGQGLAVSGSVAWRPPAVPGLDVGGYAGYNGAESASTALTDGGPGRDYVSGAAHLYWGRVPGSQPVRLKADALVIDYGADQDANGNAPGERAGGVSLLGAARPVRGTEVFARAERYETDRRDGATFLTGGASVSFSALRGADFRHVRFTGGWVHRLGAGGADAGDDGLPRAAGAIVQAQFMF